MNQNLETLIDRWMNDISFREALRADPAGTVRSTGIELTEDEWMALRAIDWNASDEELQARVSRGG